MTFDTEELELLFNARMLGTNRGMVLEPWAYPEAHRLTEAGWLRREFQPDGELAWFLTPEGERVLDVTEYQQAVHEGRENRCGRCHGTTGGRREHPR